MITVSLPVALRRTSRIGCFSARTKYVLRISLAADKALLLKLPKKRKWPPEGRLVWAGREARVTGGDGRTREVPPNAAKGSRPLLTLLPRHYHARIVRHYHTL